MVDNIAFACLSKASNKFPVDIAIEGPTRVCNKGEDKKVQTEDEGRYRCFHKWGGENTVTEWLPGTKGCR